MSELVIASGGRLHYWVPFCPYREAQARLKPGSTPFSSLELVKQAVSKSGAIGVKLYPPMGFAPYGNAQLPPKTWRSASWLSGLAHEDRFGRELDHSLQDLYTWACNEDVPILAHANTSSGPSPAFSNLAGPDHWEMALRNFPALRVVFGHFGGAEDKKDFDKAKAFTTLMSAADGGKPSPRSADVSYFPKAMDAPKDIEAALSDLLQDSADPSHVLPHRLLFGSDWKMLLLEAHANEYLTDMLAVLGALRPPPPVTPSDFIADVIGRNALRMLGLRTGWAARARIDAFYGRHRIATPIWMRMAEG